MKGKNSDDAVVAHPIRKFNPGLLQPDEEVIKQFVVRQHEFELVCDVLSQNIGTPSCQHMLVVAPRGNGKTMLLARVAAEIRRNDKLKRQFLPVRFMEENQEIDSLADFWLETLFHLAREISSESLALAQELLKTHTDLSMRWREQGIEGLAQAAVLDAVDRLNRRLVLMVENMQSLLSNMDEEFGWRLRGAMQSLPQVILVASTTSRFEELEDPSAPFFELFRIVHLEALSAKACLRLWTELTGHSPRIHEIRPLQILTGGNPRLLVMLAAFARHRSIRMLMEELVGLIDENTDYFRANLDSLPKHERRVFVSLIDLWQASNAGEIAARARLDVRVVSTMLGRLVERGAVAVVTQSKSRNRLYAATERLYSIYYKLRRERDEAAVVEVLIEFMVTFYDVGEVYRLTESLIDEAVSSTDINAGISRAVAKRPQSQDSTLSVKWRMVERTLDKVRDRQYVDAIESFQNNIQAAFRKEDWHSVLEIVEHYEKESLPLIESGLEGEPNWAHLAHIRSDAYLCLEEYRKVIEIGEDVIAGLNGTRDASMRHRACSIALNKAAAYYELGDFENSKLDCVRLDKRFGQHGSPWYDLQLASALVLHAKSEIEIGNLKPATEILNEVVNRFDNSESVDVQRVVANSMVINGRLVTFQLGDRQRASEIYGELVKRFRESEDDEILRCVESSWLNQGIVYGGSGQFEQEIECYEELVAWLDKRNAKAERPSATLALMCKSRRLAELGRAEEALASCQDSVERFDVCANQFKTEIRQWIGWHIEGTRALALMAKGASHMAINSFRSAYGAFDYVNDLHLAEMLRLVPELIAAGASERELVDVLRSDTSRAQRLLPIIVALQQRMSESVRASAETLEVAGDYEKLVSKRIVEGVRPGFVLQVENLLG